MNSNYDVVIEDERVVFLGDTHFGARSDSEGLHNQYELFYNYLFEYMKQNNLKTIIQFGDLFDRRKYINFLTLNRSRKYFFDRLKEHNYKMYTLLGNHDIFLKNSLKINSSNMLLDSYSDNIRITDKPERWSINGVSALVIPWICFDNEDQCVEEIDKSKDSLCLGHFELAGFEMYRGSICEHGLAKEMFSKFDHVYSGHFHHVSTKDNITYLGSPYQITWADYGDERGFFIFDTKTSNIEFKENPYHNFYKLTYDDSKLSLEDLDNIDYNIYDNTFVKVIIVEKEKLPLYDEFIKRLEDSGASVHVVEDHKHKDMLIEDDVDVEDINEFLKKIATTNASNEKEAKALSTYLLDLYTSASHLQQV